MLKHTEPARELSFAERNPRHLVHSPEKIVKAISDHVRLAYGKNKRSSSMGIPNGDRDRNSPDHQKGGDQCVHTLHTGQNVKSPK